MDTGTAALIALDAVVEKDWDESIEEFNDRFPPIDADSTPAPKYEDAD